MQTGERLKLVINYLKVLLSVVGICFFLQADNCHSPARVLSQHLTLENSQSGYLLYPLVKRGNSDAMSALTKLAIDSGDQYWLALAGKMGSSGALYYAAMRSQNPTQIKTWLKTSATLGHAQSQFEFALLQTSNDEKRMWMQQSAEAGYEPAIISMAKFIFESEDNSEAIIWLKKAAEFDASSAFKLANLYWNEGKTESAEIYFDKAAKQDFASAKIALQVIRQHKMEPLLSLLTVPVQGPNCAQTIQFVATTLVSFIQASAFQDQFEKDKRLADLPLCVLPPIWLQKDSLACSNNFKNEARLGCDLYPLSQLKTPLSFTHMIIFAEQGKANVNNGVMFLDQSDKYSVFVHELAHFAGFVDEYALPDDLANYHCGKNAAPNLLLLPLPEVLLKRGGALDREGEIKTQNTLAVSKLSINEETQLSATKAIKSRYLPSARENNWQRALDAHNELQVLESNTPVLHHIARSRTCKNTEYESFKPTQQMTFLEYHDVPNIPKVYRTLWRQSLLKKANYPALNDNLAISAFANNDNEAGLFWSAL
nr:sel1 repeat family protein [uncultured Glaciecola sp.]